MKTKKMLLIAVFALLFITSWTQVRQPEYPLFGILVTDPALKDMQNVPKTEDLSQIGSACLIYTSHLNTLSILRDARKIPEKTPSLIVYMGGFTTNHGGATEVEEGFRSATAMIDVTKLAAPVDKTSTTISVVLPDDGELPIKASTADVSDPDDNSKYCFWIRIDDELMQVITVDTVKGLLTVKRGLDSRAASHLKGATVFTPVYVGNRNDLGALRHSNSWPGGPDYMRYALDPRSSAAQDYKASFITNFIKSGYDGAWLDTFQGYKLFNLCDALGRPVTQYYDFNSKQRYSPELYFPALQDFIRGLRSRVSQSTGRNPVLVANNVSGTYSYGGKSLFSTPENPDLLDGYCFEDSYLHIESATNRSELMVLAPGKIDRWKRNLTNQSDAANQGLNAYNMIAMAGYVAGNLNQRQPHYDRLIRFGYCSFLLTVTKDKTSLFGLPLFLTEVNENPAIVPWPEIIFAPVGDPVDGTFNAEKKAGLKAEYYQRHFTNGLVIVNPHEAKPVTVQLPSGYMDWQTHKPVTSVHLVEGDAALFLRQTKAK
jgi:hypothetical protein